MANSKWFRERYAKGLCTNCKRPRYPTDHHCLYHKLYTATKAIAPQFWWNKHKYGRVFFIEWWYNRFKALVKYGGEEKSLYQVAVDVLECFDSPVPGGSRKRVYSPTPKNGNPIDIIKVARRVKSHDRMALNEYRTRVSAHAEDPPAE